MNITKLAALVVTAIVVTGCATTPRTAQFNPNNKDIKFEGGKPYLIPYGTAIIPGMEIGSAHLADMDGKKSPIIVKGVILCG